MKKLSFMAMSALLVLGVASCKKNSDVQNPESKEGMVKTVFSAVSNEGKEKTSISGSDILWSEGDQVKIYAGTSTAGSDFTLTDGAGKTSAIFEGWISETATAPYYAVYPSESAQGIDGSAIKYSIPAEQAYVENSFATKTVPMVAYSAADKSLAFKNQTAFIKLQLTGAGTIATMTLESASNNICGTFSVGKTDPAAASTAVTGAKKITVTGINGTALDATTPKNVIIAVAPANFVADNLTLSMTASDGKVFSTTLGGFNVGRSQGKAVEIEVEFESYCKTCTYTEAVTDICGNKYNLITIGSQTWMAENMRCNKYGNSSERAGATLSTSTTTKTDPYYTPTRSGDPAAYGYYYNWAAAMGYKNQTEAEGQTGAYSGTRQGICPDGFHIPSRTELGTLETAAKVGGDNRPGKHLKACDGWNSNGNGDNETCFAALPAGYANGSSVNNVGANARCWSSDAYKSSGAYYRSLYYSNDNFSEYGDTKDYAYSVRCLKN